MYLGSTYPVQLIHTAVRTLRYHGASDTSGQPPASEYPEGSDLRQKMRMYQTVRGTWLPAPEFEITETSPLSWSSFVSGKNPGGMHQCALPLGAGSKTIWTAQARLHDKRTSSRAQHGVNK